MIAVGVTRILMPLQPRERPMQLRRRRLVGYIAAVVCASAMSGCGQKGPLYLPDESTATSQSAEQTQHRPDQLEYIKLANQQEQEK